jgi:hypothetical protein
MFAVKNTFSRGLRMMAMPAARMSLASNPAFAAACVAGANRAFSSGVVNSGASKLSRALDKEVKYENDNYQ